MPDGVNGIVIENAHNIQSFRRMVKVLVNNIKFDLQRYVRDEKKNKK